MLSHDKITAIYDLRAAVEAKVHAEHALDEEPSPDTRAALLDAALDLEAKTQTAIEVCHECGHAHESDRMHSAPAPSSADNVINVDFGGG